MAFTKIQIQKLMQNNNNNFNVNNLRNCNPFNSW